MADKFDLKVQLEADYQKFERALHRAIDLIADFQSELPKASKEVDRLEKELVDLAQAASNTATGLQQSSKNVEAIGKDSQTAAKGVDKLTKEINALQRITNKQGASSVSELVTPMALSQQRAKELSQAHTEALKLNEAFDKQADSLGRITREYEGLANTRYALYDVASTWRNVSLATLGSAIAIEAVGASYQHALADVQRTSGAVGAEWNALESDLIGMSKRIPVAFQDITSVATIAGQLDIAADKVAGFTENVIQFAATTDVSVEQTAMGFGRIVQLTGTAQDKIANVGSAVYEVGVNSVATEGQILTMGQEIATVGNLAGFTAEEIIGLSGTLASVGVQSYRARGSLLRVFGQFDKAAADGGEALDKFAARAGMTAEQFAAAWRDTPEKAFRSLLEGLADATEAGANMNLMLRDLGITGTLDIQTIQQLANNMDVYTNAQNDANRAFAEGTALADGYAQRTDTLTSSLTVLSNNLKSIMNTLSNSDALKVVVDQFSRFLGLIDSVLSTGFGQALALVFTGLLAGVGIFAALRAGVALTRAAIAGLMQAEVALAASQKVLNQGVLGLIGSYRQLRRELAGVKAEQSGLTVSTGLSGGVAKIAKYGRAFTGVGLAMLAVDGIARLWGNRVEENQRKADAAAASMQAYTESLRADQSADPSTVIRTMTVEAEDNRSTLASWATALEGATGAQVSLSEATAETTKETVQQTVAIAEATDQALRLQIANSEAVQKAFKDNAEALSEYDWSELLTLGLAEGADAAKAEIDAWSDYVSTEMARVRILLAGPSLTADEATLLTQELAALSSKKEALGVISSAIVQELKTIDETASELKFGDALAKKLGIVNEEIEETTTSIKDMVEELYGMIDATIKVESATERLGKTLADNGTNFDIYTTSGRQNMEAFAATVDAIASNNSPTEAATKIMGLLQALQAMGVSTRTELTWAYELVDQLARTGGSGLGDVRSAADSATRSLNSGFTPAVTKAGGASKKAAKEVRTLTDYVSDLGRVMDAASTFRFGLDMATDDVADAFLTMRDYAEAAARAIADANQEIIEIDARIKGLRASNNTLTYQLAVAREYGDTLREQGILAEMADNEAKLAAAERDRADAQKQLADAQDAATRDLSGATKGSREQRAQVLALLDAYQEQVTALANTGMSQRNLQRHISSLRGTFQDQVRQLGYNTSETAKYTKAFDDMNTIVDRLPKNLTLSVNANPAIRALDEYLAKVKQAQTATNNLGKSAPTPKFNAQGMLDGMIRAGKAAANLAKISQLQVQLSRAQNPTSATSLAAQIAALSALRFATGGLVPGLHPGTPKGKDTVPAWLSPGEYVVKPSAVAHYGLPFMNAINNMQTPRFMATQGATAANQQQMIQSGMTAADRMFFAQLFKSLRLEVDGRQLGRIVQNVNRQGVITGNA